ncbi:SH3 domain-containing protein [Streptomyces tropicalis]|uniref:SH3 domain-containing protein n=1 Tax=Streptomyces tropicalis TaxID=3034234 RepID=A0ABT6AAV9_9ACTN|nr:SH3 domain-containing protein [Streptomyces tropicalis]MDF3301780.1 SH3 domain-containing protein [Streptomyces tropicalis]
MIRRSLTGGLLTAVAVLALAPSAHAAPVAPVPQVSASAAAPRLLPAPVTLPAGQAPAAHRAVRPVHRLHPARRTHCLRPIGRLTVHRRVLQPVGRVTTVHFPLNVRSGPGTGYRVIGVRHAHRALALTCRTHGSWVRGNRQWYRLTYARGWVSARYVRVRTALPWC